jgi:acetyl-CoA carboxylase carboxyltransferase component
LRVYDIRAVIETLADEDRCWNCGVYLVLRWYGFGRIEGRAIGLVANNSMHLAGAIDSDSADKAARFINFVRRI